mmetsp:Transcript_22948/g.64484  ORF Transcript_22948/g.64484 Transcript_22948/m.64484 type:complete len:215 (+) Transcript_22948:75-719(+)
MPQTVVHLTHIVYDSDDGLWGALMAHITLAPLCIAVGLPAFFLARRELQTLYFVLGHGVNEVLNLLLKYSIREPRPAGSPKYGFGMPSSHAQFMFFFATYFTLLLVTSNLSLGVALPRGLPLRAAAVWTIFLGAVVVSYTRIFLGVHTWAQVIVGAMVGAMTAVVWYAAMVRIVRPRIFPWLQTLSISRCFYIKDNSHVPNVLEFEFRNAKKGR